VLGHLAGIRSTLDGMPTADALEAAERDLAERAGVAERDLAQRAGAADRAGAAAATQQPDSQRPAPPQG
jgi:hypothetical protein